jgi:hypothetical protein
LAPISIRRVKLMNCKEERFLKLNVRASSWLLLFRELPVAQKLRPKPM